MFILKDFYEKTHEFQTDFSHMMLFIFFYPESPGPGRAERTPGRKSSIQNILR